MMRRYRSGRLLALLVLLSSCGDGIEFGSVARGVGPAKVSPQIKIDQFGYRPGDSKVAVLVDPQAGFNAADAYSPGSTLEVRRWSDDQVVFSGAATPWNSGQMQASSGDRGWWFDFSTVSLPGSYYLFDPQNQVGSHRFDIADQVYAQVLRAATRMFFYNRCGAAKKPPYTDARWQDEAAYLGPGQDSQARSVTEKDNPATTLDLRGGWFDAGDTNKYVTFANVVIHQLLSAYQENPAPWTDDYNIPESGNGLPDIIDEIKWELDWVKRMQREDGGVLIKVGVIDYNEVSPPGNDKRPRYYAPKCSSSSIAAASMFAHAALALGKLPGQSSEVADLTSRAVKGWNWYQQNTKRSDCDTQEIKSGDADVSLEKQARVAVVAAIYLFALTGEAKYHDLVKSSYQLLRPWFDMGWSRYDSEEGEAILYYTTLPGADAKVKADVLAKKKQDATTSGDVYVAAIEKDLYRAYITDNTYHWGSNQPRTENGNTAYEVITFGIDPGKEAGYRERALGILHYIHGVNPIGMVYLTNMASYGAEVSASEIYHAWFANGTEWDSAKTSPKGPAPGYMPGGPNQSYSGPSMPPKGEPPQKAYRDWNTPWPDASWEITEPGIYYQASYVKLLSKFVPAPARPTTDGGGAVPGREGGLGGEGPTRTTEAGSPSQQKDRLGDGCSCQTTGPSSVHGWPLLLLVLLMSRRRRSGPA